MSNRYELICYLKELENRLGEHLYMGNETLEELEAKYYYTKYNMERTEHLNLMLEKGDPDIKYKDRVPDEDLKSLYYKEIDKKISEEIKKTISISIMLLDEVRNKYKEVDVIIMLFSIAITKGNVKDTKMIFRVLTNSLFVKFNTRVNFMYSICSKYIVGM